MDTLTPLDRAGAGHDDHGPPRPRRRRADAHGRHRRSGGRRSRRVAGRRQAARTVARRRAVRRTGTALLVLAVTAGLVVGGSALLDRRTPAPAASAPAPASVLDAAQATVLLVRVPGRDAGAAAPAAGLTLLSTDPVGGASVVFVPSTSLVEIPGVGLDRLGLAQQYGGTDLTVAAVENALGVEVTAGVALDDRALGAVLDVAADEEVALGRRLVERDDAGEGTVRFEAGTRAYAGPRLAELWSFAERGETELDTFARQQVVLQALLRAVADPQARAAALDAVPAVDRAVVDRVLGDLALAATSEEVAFQLLPVRPFGAADARLGTSYQLQEQEVAALLDRLMPGAAPAGAGSGTPIQVLNGVGIPGVGQRVDRALQGVGVRIVRTDNARSFSEQQTRIVIYEETEEMLALAQRVHAALGVGTILVSRQPQSVVDLTIVVGHDFATTGLPQAPGV